MEAGDIVVDGGNSYYRDDIERAKRLQPKGIDYLDVGTSGGVWGLERGYCQMIGGPDRAVQYLDAVFATLAPGRIGATHAGTGRSAAPLSTATCIAGRAAPGISSRWCTTASNTASWRPMPKA